jgi:hypothetical protein
MSVAPARPWRLPVLANPTQKLVGALAVIAACVPLYLVPAALTAQRAVFISMPAWERAIPYLPWTVWAYLAQYPLLAAVYYGSGASLMRCTRFLYALLMVQTMAAAAFLILPLRYPRDGYLLPPDTDTLTAAAANWVRAIDAPVNCCPSLHVTSCMLCLALVGRPWSWRSALFAAMATASMASTLTFKQHYAIDLPAGALLAAAGWWLAGVGMGPWAKSGDRAAAVPGH